MMVGDKRKYNAMFVTLRADGATGELPGSEETGGPEFEVNPDAETTTGARPARAQEVRAHPERCVRPALRTVARFLRWAPKTAAAALCGRKE